MDCPFCGGKLLPAENIVDEIIDMAFLHGVNLMIVEHRQDLLTRYDGIAAVTYSHVTQA
jgi:peptide subunit release factor 1 (eRF1)